MAFCAVRTQFVTSCRIVKTETRRPCAVSVVRGSAILPVRTRPRVLSTLTQEAAMTTSAEPNISDRAKAALLGSFVADAATMPLHWIYDIPKIEALLADQNTTTPEFYATPSCTFYKMQRGYQSPYGDEVFTLLQSVTAKGGFDAQDYAQSMANFFTSHPDNFRNRSVRAVLTGVEAGKQGIECGDPEDFQANCFAKVAVLVARYAGQPELPSLVEQAVRVQQNNEAAVKYGLASARILERVVLGQSIEEALASTQAAGELLPELQSLVDRATAQRSHPLTELTYEPVSYMKEMVDKHMAIKEKLEPFSLAVWCNGPACGNPAAFTNAITCAVTYPTFVDGVRANMLAGGDNCSRSMLVGALLAAQGGMESIPVSWRQETVQYAVLEEMAEKVLEARH